MDQKRLLLAFVLSAAILFGWSYLFPPPANDQQNANTSQPAVNATATPAPAVAVPTNQADAPSLSANLAAPDTTPERLLTVSTPLYQIKFDSRGATPKNWIIKQIREKNGEVKPLRSASSTRDNPQSLELISPEGLSR